MFIGLDNNIKYIIYDIIADFIVTNHWVRNKETGSEPDTNYSLSFSKDIKNTINF